MSNITYISRAFILAVILMVFGLTYVYCQDVKSNISRIKISNLPDTSPPSIKIMTPTSIGGTNYKTNTEEIVLIGEVTDKSGVKFVSVNDDVRSINEVGIFTSRIQLAPGENRIQLSASDHKDNFHEEFITIEYIPPVVTLADRITEVSNYYGLIIGIDNYQDPKLPDLDNPINDAEKLQRTLIEKYTFDRGNMMLLRDPNRNDIVYALDYLASQVTPDDNVLIFYAGHGNWDENANIGYWLPSDASLSTTANWFRNSALVDYLKMINSKHTLLITDACFAGSIFKTRSGFPNQDRAYEVLYELPSRKAMTSGHLSEVPDRSSFIRFLLDRLNENQEAYLSSEQLFSSFRIAVINNSDAIPMYGDIQNVGDEGGDFIFLKKK